MSISFTSFGRVKQADTRPEDSIRSEMEQNESCLHRLGVKIKYALAQMKSLRHGSSLINHTGQENLTVCLTPCRDVISKLSEKHTIRDAYCAIESRLSEYATEVSEFATRSVQEVRAYTTNLFEIFMRKTRITKDIDTSKFKVLDSTVEMDVINYGDYIHFESVLCREHAAVVQEVKGLLYNISQAHKQLELHVSNHMVLDELADAIKNLKITKFLTEEKLVEMRSDMDETAVRYYSVVTRTPRLMDLEQRRVLQDAGWDSVLKIQNSRVLREASKITESINQLYKYTVDVMDESRKLSDKYTMQEPVICVNLVRFGNILAQLVASYAKVFDVCWTSAIRVTNACSIQEVK